LRRAKSLVIAVGVFALVAQLVFHFVVAEGFHTADAVIAALHLGAIAVGFACVPAPRPVAVRA
jgi:hypothetical protein